MTQNFERRLVESADEIMRKLTGRIAHLEAKIRQKIKKIRENELVKLGLLSSGIEENAEAALGEKIRDMRMRNATVRDS